MKRPSALTLVTLALIVLLPALAVLQYRWVGQVSTAERERMQRTLRVAAFQFREAFDGELGRAMLSLQVGQATARDGASGRFTDRYDNWLNTATHPQIVSNIYLVDSATAPGPDTLRLRRWDAEQRTFVDAPWPARLERWRDGLREEQRRFDPRRPDRRNPFPVRDDALLVSPLRNMEGPRQGAPGQLPPFAAVFGYTLVELDLDYIRTQFLPELAQRHFTHTDGDAYRVAVTAATDPRQVIYRSDNGAPFDVTQADVTESLYGPDPLFFLRRGGDSRRGNRSIIVNVIEGQTSTQPATVRPQPDTGRWRLAVQHQSGSLEAAVGEVRRRNLAISFGVLMLLTLSVGMLSLSSRRAQRLARQQMEFVAGVSHELRTPVAVIKSAAENLSQGVVGTGDRVKTYGAMIEGEARRLGEMVERVLQYAGIESGLGLGERVPLAPEQIIDGAIESSRPLIASEQVQIHRDIALNLPQVMGDAAALRSAVQNLIANAVKYGGSDRWVGVRAEFIPGRRRGAVGGGRGEVRISVSDHGAGIPPAELPHIFEPFYRGADALARQIHGNGLGLSLVRRIAASHGGRVSVAARPGGGSEFTLALPAAKTQPRPQTVASEIGAPVHS